MDQNLHKYKDLLTNPPESARGLTRWWWYGCSLSEEDILVELNEIKLAGIGGVEIQTLYPLSEDSESLNIKNRAFFSPEFFDILKFTVDKANEMGLIVDLTLGSGWPYGGPFIDEDMAPQIILPYQQDLKGPMKYSYDFTTILSGNPVRAILAKSNQHLMGREDLINVTDCIGTKYLHGWPWGYEIKDMEVPEGQWKLFLFVEKMYKQRVGYPAPGMDGYVIDHCRKDVSDYYFKTLGDPILEKIGDGKIRSFFCDSIELGGNNWTSILLEEFKKRRGYDLAPYMPALWGEIEDITPMIRFDYHQTFGELTYENFFLNFADYCKRKGVQSRIQAHGTWGDILQTYAAADIPEGETFGEHDKYYVNTVHRKLATSAGHLYNKNIISNETFTWLRSPRYLVTLEMMKAAVDAVFIDGINQIINHGYSSSPQEIGKPGWSFYASSFISQHNTWWKYYKELGSYIQTVSAFLQEGHSVVEVGIYIPQADIRASMPLAELHMALKIEEYIGSKLVNQIQQNGYYFDYLNDDALTRLGECTNDGLKVNHNCYKVIILPNVKRIPLETVEKLQEFVGNGGVLLALDQVPSSACGLMNYKQNTSNILQIMRKMFEDEGIWNNVGMGSTLWIHQCKMITKLKEVLTPDLYIDTFTDKGQIREKVGYVHRRNNDDEIYFVANISNEYQKAKLTFKQMKANVIILDPLTKKESFSFKREGSILLVELDPYQSYVIILTEKEGSQSQVTKLISREETNKFSISKDWEIEIKDRQRVEILPVIKTWERIEGLKDFSGEGIYKKTINISKPNQCEKVDLVFENIYHTAEVFLNGELAGVIWKAPYKIDITTLVNDGKNKLEIKVRNLWINHMINQVNTETNRETVIEQWPYFSAIIDNYQNKFLHPTKEKQTIKVAQPSGISGDVNIVYYKEG